MEPISAVEIAQAIRGQIKSPLPPFVKGGIKGGLGERCFARISTDSRHIQPGDLFVALKGKHFNGHDFVLDALARGAAGVIVSHDFFLNVSNTDVVLISVNDTLKALGDLAAYYLQKLPTRIIAVTGSNGKTTTKDIIHHLLSQPVCVLHTGRCARATKSPKNFNNCIGVPLTVFELNRQVDFGVIEFGTNAPGEIRRLSEIARPHMAVFTNISETHLEGLGSVEGVAKEKGEMLDYIGKACTERNECNGTIVINADNVWCSKIADSFSGRVIRFGINNQAQIKGSNVSRTDLGLSFTVNDDFRVNVPFYGIHNVYNCLAALAVCYALGFDIEKLSKSLLSFRLPAMRMDRSCLRQIRRGEQNIGNIVIINDAYNANPQSMIAALNEYSEMKVRGRKIFICGDMLELGNHAERLHKELGIKVAHSGIDLLLTVGKLSRYVAESATANGMAKENITCYDNLDELLASIVYCLKDSDTILIKGSRRIGLEGIQERIKSFFPQNVPPKTECRDKLIPIKC